MMREIDYTVCHCSSEAQSKSDRACECCKNERRIAIMKLPREVSIRRVRLNVGGYADNDRVYFGIGAPLYQVCDESGLDHSPFGFSGCEHFRAENRQDAFDAAKKYAEARGFSIFSTRVR